MVETPEGLRHRAFGGEAVDMQAEKPFDYLTVAQVRRLPFITGPVQVVGDTTLRLIVNDAGTAIPELMEWAQAQNLPLTSVEAYNAPLDDVFVELVGREKNRE
jgi:hypothetical protein